MSGNIIIECRFWLASIVTGAGMAFAYDFLRIFRRLLKHGRLAVDIEDILYWFVCFIVSFTLLYYGNNGVMRLAAVMGAAIGMLIYENTIGCIFVKNVLALCRILVKVMRKVFKPIRKLLLTLALFKNKIKLYSLKIKVCGKGETKRGKKQLSKKQLSKKQLSEKHASKRKAKKNARVSPVQK